MALFVGGIMHGRRVDATATKRLPRLDRYQRDVRG